MSTGLKGSRAYSGLGLQNVTGLWLRKPGVWGLGEGVWATAVCGKTRLAWSVHGWWMVSKP